MRQPKRLSMNGGPHANLQLEQLGPESVQLVSLVSPDLPAFLLTLVVEGQSLRRSIVLCSFEVVRQEYGRKKSSPGQSLDT